jgi:hypothetical protein
MGACAYWAPIVGTAPGVPITEPVRISHTHTDRSSRDIHHQAGEGAELLNPELTP